MLCCLPCYSQLWGEGDPDEDVSPDSADPELQDRQASTDPAPANGANNTNGTDTPALPAANEAGNVERTSTRAWAQSHGYDPQVTRSKMAFFFVMHVLLFYGFL